MSLSPRLRWTVLGAALCFSIVAAAWVGNKDRQTEPGSPVPDADRDPDREQALAPKKTGDDHLALNLDKLNRAGMSDAGQNIFAGKSWYVPPVPPKPQPPSAPSAPPLPFTFMGKLQEESGRLIVYLVKGDTAYTVAQGDVIDNTYKVEDVAAAQMTLTYLPLNIKQTLAIGSNP